MNKSAQRVAPRVFPRLGLLLPLLGMMLGYSIQADELVAETATSADIVLVIGAAGEEEFGKQFMEWAEPWQRVAASSSTKLELIGQNEQGEITDHDRIKSVIESSAVEQRRPLWLVLIGHGTNTRGVAKFNLRGPDMSAQELSEWLQPMQRPVVIVNCAAASGPFVNALSAPNRIVVTATKSGSEQNFARFGKYFAQAIAAADSDLDHDDEVSVQEAFIRAAAETMAFYEADARIATEHALIDDNGDGKGTPAGMFRGTRPIAKAKDGSELDGKSAARITLVPTGDRLVFTDDELAQRSEIEGQLDLLRQQKPELDAVNYEQKLEELMLRLARIYQAAEARLNP